MIIYIPLSYSCSSRSCRSSRRRRRSGSRWDSTGTHTAATTRSRTHTAHAATTTRAAALPAPCESTTCTLQRPLRLTSDYRVSHLPSTHSQVIIHTPPFNALLCDALVMNAWIGLNKRLCQNFLVTTTVRAIGLIQQGKYIALRGYVMQKHLLGKELIFYPKPHTHIPFAPFYPILLPFQISWLLIER